MPKNALNNKTILQIVPELNTGGVEQTVLDMSAAIIAAGGTAIVCAHGGRLVDSLKSSGAEFISMPVHSKNPFVQLKNYFALKALIKARHIDLVHVRSRAPALAALSAAKACGAATVTTYHGIYNAKSTLKRRYNGLMTKADVIIANSDFTRNHVLKTYDVAPDHVVAISRGINMARFDTLAIDEARKAAITEAWGIKNDGRTRFILAGRLTRWKGQGVIIEACAALMAQGMSNFVVYMAGDDQGRSDYVDELKTAIATHGLADHIKLVGHCADMPAAYSLCDYALAPSTDPEAFGRTAVEPQAMGLPVLASNHGATIETVNDGQTGWLITPADVIVWRDAMAKAIALSPDERARTAQKARAHVEGQFSLEQMCDQTITVYQRLLV